MRISDWSSDVCSSDLAQPRLARCAIGGIGDEDTEDDDGLVAGLAGAERGHAASGGRISSAGVLYRLPQRPNARGIINAMWSRTFLGGLQIGRASGRERGCEEV